jgi:hypothetical protein
MWYDYSETEGPIKNIAIPVGLYSGILFGIIASFMYLLTFHDQPYKTHCTGCLMALSGIVAVIFFTIISVVVTNFLSSFIAYFFYKDQITAPDPYQPLPTLKIKPDASEEEISELLHRMKRTYTAKKISFLDGAKSLNKNAKQIEACGERVVPIILKLIQDLEFRTEASTGPREATPYDYFMGILNKWFNKNIAEQLKPIAQAQDSIASRISQEFLAATVNSETIEIVLELLKDEDDSVRYGIYKGIGYIDGKKLDVNTRQTLFDAVLANIDHDGRGIYSLIELDKKQAISIFQNPKYLNAYNDHLSKLLYCLYECRVKLDENRLIEIETSLMKRINSDDSLWPKHAYVELIALMKLTNPSMARQHAIKVYSWNNEIMTENVKRYLN